MNRRFVSEKEMQDYVKSYRKITEDNYKNGIIDRELYLEIMHEIEQQCQENKQALAINRLLAANIL